MADKSIDERVSKDINTFYENVGLLSGRELATELRKIYELAIMYAKDSESYKSKGDLITAFSCISYAHGLLDAVLKICKVDRYDI